MLMWLASEFMQYLTDLYVGPSGSNSTIASVLITAAGFLFAVHSFLVIRIKEAVYDNDQVRRKILDKHGLKGESLSPLKRLSGTILLAVVLCLLQGITHMVLGPIEGPTAVIVFVVGDVLCFSLVALTLWRAHRAFRVYLDVSEGLLRDKLADEALKDFKRPDESE